MNRIRAFISFAAEDARGRDLFVGQGKHPDTPWEIADWSLHEPFSERWKTQTRARIVRCHTVIQLVGRKTYLADGAIWEVNCAIREGIPTFGVWISQDLRGPVPSCFGTSNIIDWTWEGIGSMIRKAYLMRRGSRNYF
jgi:hypothetical protein